SCRVAGTTEPIPAEGFLSGSWRGGGLAGWRGGAAPLGGRSCRAPEKLGAGGREGDAFGPEGGDEGVASPHQGGEARAGVFDELRWISRPGLHLGHGRRARVQPALEPSRRTVAFRNVQVP